MAWTVESVTLVGGVEVSNQSAVPVPRFASWMPEYCVMVLYSPVVPNWLRKACRVRAYGKSGEAALLKLGPQKMKTTLAEVIIGAAMVGDVRPPWAAPLTPRAGK